MIERSLSEKKHIDDKCNDSIENKKNKKMRCLVFFVVTGII